MGRRGWPTVTAGTITWLQKQKAIVRPKSPLCQALTYMDRQWKHLQVFVDDPSVSADNNEAERLLRQVALGHKTTFFARQRFSSAATTTDNTTPST